MRIVLTNDDGYLAPGLAVLSKALRGWSDVEVHVVAPEAERSGISHAVSGRFCCWDEYVTGMGRVTVVDGTPGDCARLAITRMNESKPDWVFAGINRGANLGVETYYSGTVAAAREAAVLGVPSVAISQLVRPGQPDDWDRAAREAASVLAAIIWPGADDSQVADSSVFQQARDIVRGGTGDKGDKPVCWNVNLPKCPSGKPVVGVRFVPVSSDPLPVMYQRDVAQNSVQMVTYTGEYLNRARTPGTDVEAVFSDMIAVSRLTFGG